MDTYKGSGVSPGIGLGKFYVINNEIDFSIPKKLSFKESQKKLDKRYKQLISELEKENRQDESEVLDAYRLIVNDPEIIEMVDDGQNLQEIFQAFKDTSDQMLSIEDEVLENFDCVVTANELGSSIKKISDGKIVEHLNRENYKKLTYPLFLKSETFLQFLKENNSEWNLIKFLENHTFMINQI